MIWEVTMPKNGLTFYQPWWGQMELEPIFCSLWSSLGILLLVRAFRKIVVIGLEDQSILASEVTFCLHKMKVVEEENFPLVQFLVSKLKEIPLWFNVLIFGGWEAWRSLEDFLTLKFWMVCNFINGLKTFLLRNFFV